MEYLKIICLWIFILWIEFKKIGTLANDIPVFLVVDDKCITNQPSAMAFNAPIDDTKNTLSDFFPPLDSSNVQDIGCKIENGEPCIKDWESDIWKIGTSLEGPVQQLITDWRWEALKLYKTEAIDITGGSLDYKQVLIPRKENFEVPISIRIESEGHVFLCSGGGRTPYYSDCYWLMLQAFKGTKSAVRKCPINAISNEYGKWPKPPCSISQQEREHNGEHILSEDFWSHFTITKRNNTICVTRNNEELLKFTDHEQPFPVRSMFLHSKRVNGLWKIHDYTYLYTTQQTTQQLGPQFIQITEGQACLSMFVIMCSTCEMLIRLQDTRDKDSYIYNQTFKTEDENWKEIKILANPKINGNGNYKLYVSTLSTSDNLDLFWAIDHFRRCNETEYRILKSPKENVPCQLVENEKTINIKNLRTKEISELEINCPESTFGRTCIPCQIFGREFCSNIKYCENFNEGKQCFCTPGFYSRDCSKSCFRDKYGHGCNKYCGLCDGECRYIDGICKTGKCLQDFKGNKCDLPPAPLFKDPPSILRTEPTTCAVRVTNFETTNGTESALYYKIQYKEIVGNRWVEVGTDYDFMSSPEVIITGLEPDTEYYVRAVLYLNKYNVYEGSVIKKIKFRTSCNPIRFEDIAIKPDNTSASVSLKIYSETCKIKNYAYGIDSDDPKEAEEHFEVSRLKPFNTYRFTLSHVHYPESNVSKLFSTKEGVPSIVTSLHALEKSSTSINLVWGEPLEKNGVILHYIVKYRLIKGKECSDEDKGRNNFYTKTAEATSFVLESLNPYSVYEIQVCAVTSAGAGKNYSIEVETDISEYLLETEIPQIVDKNINACDITVVLNTLKCKEINGPIYLSFEVKCENEWCLKPINLKTKYNIADPMVKLENLFPNVIYTLVMKVSRFETDWSGVKEIADEFATKPSRPNFINSIEVTSKDESSISLRWKPPYPPTGTLREYKIKYTTETTFRTYNYELEFKPMLCKLWPNYHCATIREKIYNGYKYNIQIWATNESPWQYVKIYNKAFMVTATEDVPEPPYDVIETWTGNNGLQVSWKHPNATNGLLGKFVIDINTGGRRSKKINEFTKYINSENDYNLTYTYQINQTDLQPCSKYAVTVVAHNKNYKKISKSIDIWSPPPAPPYMSKEELTTSSTNHTITINIPRLKDNNKNMEKIPKKLYMLISNSDVTANESNNDADKFENFIYTKQNPPILSYSRLILEINQQNLPIAYKIGNSSTLPTEYKNLSNPPLEPGKAYRIYLFFVNECNGKIRLSKVNKTIFTTGDPTIFMPEGSNDTNGSLYFLILLIFLIPLLGYAYMRVKRKNATPEIFKIFKQPESSTVIREPLRNQKHDDEIPLSEKEPVRTHPMIKPRTSVNRNIPNIPVIKTTHSKLIRINDFELYVKESIQNGELIRQHELFPRGQTKPWDCGALKVNKSKNRYNNLIAYDHTRVKLNKIPGDQHSDYINANYIDGYRISRAYIATQGPKSSTLNDFWRMIWDEKVKHIIMLANVYEGGKKKVEKYWPDINEEIDFDGIKVQYISTEVFADYEYRVFNVNKNSVQRKVEQLHFTSWPDHGVPLYPQSLVPFLQRILKIPNNSNSPVVVHCSAGVGRTGTIILCDICLRMAAGEGSIDFLSRLEHLRSQRANMVDNIEQYKLAHIVVLECLFGMHTSIACNEDMDSNIEMLLNNDGIKAQLKYLEDTEWQDQAMDTIWEVEEMPIYPEKNRFQDIVPGPQHRVYLLRYPPKDERSSYINAVQVDGFRSPGRFIVTQQPMPNTLGDFWRLVVERKSTVIVSLNEINQNDKTSCQFWPDNDATINPVDYLQICHVNSTSLNCYRIITVRVINKKENENILVNIICINNWMPNDLLPNSVEEYLSFWEESDVLARKSGSVIVTCYNGATASGIYIATSFLIEKMKLEQECDVCLAVRTIRHNRKQFIASEEQFAFLYRASVTYINGFQSYANFT